MLPEAQEALIDPLASCTNANHGAKDQDRASFCPTARPLRRPVRGRG
jgi:hypothetical protein